MTIRTHPDVGFRLERLEVHGRLENGEAPVRPSDAEVAIEHTPASPSQRAGFPVSALLVAVCGRTVLRTVTGCSSGLAWMPSTRAFCAPRGAPWGTLLGRR